MKTEQRNKNKLIEPKLTSGEPSRVALIGLATVLITGFGIAAYAANALLHGYITVTERRNQDAPVNSFTTKSNGGKVFDLVDKYGQAAISPAVAEAIKRAERAAPNATATSDRYEALTHGVWKPGADPMMAIMYGYVPPGMDQRTTALLARSLPQLPRMPQPLTVEQMAGEPLDPLAASLPEGLTPSEIEAANHQMLSSYMRERFGPVYVPPLHRPVQSIVAGNVSKDHQGSIREMVDASGSIAAQYTYTPFGERTKISGSGPDADFGFQGMYYHARSGLSLTPHRAYDPKLGRWLSRDPIDDPTFKLMPKSPEPADPSPGRSMVLAQMKQLDPKLLAMTPIQLMQVTRNPVLRQQLARLVPSGIKKPAMPDANPYVFVSNDPVNLTDPSGLSASGPCPNLSQCIWRCIEEAGNDLDWLAECLKKCREDFGDPCSGCQ